MSTTETLAPIHKAVTIDAPPETAFDTFTRKLATWWPSTHSVYEDRVADIVFDEHEGGRVYERSADGEEADWADVIVFERPHRLLLRWRVNPNRRPTEVEVRFVAEGDSTRIELEHRGWDDAADPEGRSNYDTGWELVLDRYADVFGAATSE